MSSEGAGAWRQLAAASYDGLLLLAVLMVATLLVLLATHGQAVTPRGAGAWEYLFRAALAACVAGYFGIGWTRRGQTLGMKAWHIRLETRRGTPPGWPAALARLACAATLYLVAIGGIAAYIARLAHAPLLLASLLPIGLSLGVHACGGGGTLPDRVSATRVVRTGPQ